MDTEALRSPAEYLKRFAGATRRHKAIADYDAWWKAEGSAISETVDRAGTPWLRMFDKLGNRVDEILFPPDYWRMLRKGYAAGVLWRAFDEMSLVPSYELLYLVSFYDPGLACPYTVSLSTVVPIWKYGNSGFEQEFIANMLRKEGNGWQGATWMTEVKGGSDLGAAVETAARAAGGRWLLNGDKHFASNVGADLAVVAARFEGAPQTVRGLGLFVVPRLRRTGELNYFVRRLKDKVATRSVPTGEVELRESEAYLLGEGAASPSGRGAAPMQLGIYLILEVLNISRVANSVGSVALAQRAMADALDYAQNRTAFGKAIIEHPLLRRQFEERIRGLRSAFALAWEAVRLLDEVWQEKPPYSERYHLFRLVAHLAKYWTAEFAVQTAKWAMEVHGGVGAMQECGAERWLRESMILAIWEGTSHRQILDGLEVIERKSAHELLLKHLAPCATTDEFTEMRSRIEETLALPPEERQASAEQMFRDLAVFVGEALSHKQQSVQEAAQYG